MLEEALARRSPAAAGAGRSPSRTDRVAGHGRADPRHRRVRIALVGKYVRLHDAYLSVVEALRHAGYADGAEVDIAWVDAEN